MFSWFYRADLARLSPLIRSIFIIMSENARYPEIPVLRYFVSPIIFFPYAMYSRDVVILRTLNVFIKQHDITTSRFILARVIADKARIFDVITFEMSCLFHSRESGPAERPLILSIVNVVCFLSKSKRLFVNNRMKSRGCSRATQNRSVRGGKSRVYFLDVPWCAIRCEFYGTDIRFDESDELSSTLRNFSFFIKLYIFLDG